MKSYKYILTALLSLAFSITANAKETNIETTGVGDDYDWAVLNGLENAVRQSNGAYINQTASIVKELQKDFVDIKIEDGKVFTNAETNNLNGNISTQIKTIENHYQGRIKSYKVKGMEEKNNKVYVTLDTVVDVAENMKTEEPKVPEVVQTTVVVKEEYKSPEIVQKPEHTIAVMPFKGLRTYSCGKNSIPLSTVNHNIAASLNKGVSRTKLFSVLSRDDLYEYSSEMELSASDLARSKDKLKLGNLATADYMIIGTINEFQSFTNTKKIEPTGETYSKSFAKMVVNYNLVETATTEIIFTDVASASIDTESEALSCEKLLRELTDKLSASVVNDTMKAVFPNYQPAETKKSEDSVSKTITTTQTREVIKLPYDK
ncbi:MAG: CsgG/HfaB family protein [Lactobacillaceae bacterium]|jgi:curli biogenesis system outer membrane secretion channel CsgG|nr:CsgG/HfaB family protein [Lactobacillaceae bacterium]